MTVLLFLGWLILNTLWGFLPLVEPLRQAALRATSRRRGLALASGLLAWAGALLSQAWFGNYSAAILAVYDAHTVSGVAGVAGAPLFAVATDLTLRQFVPGLGCLNDDPAVCALAAQALQPGSLSGMLPFAALFACLPGLLAVFICWKLTAVSPAAVPA